jgi:hypothetical protein
MPMLFSQWNSPARHARDSRLCDRAGATADSISAKIRRDPHGPYDPAGIIVVASVWLAFYVANVIHLL